MQFYCEYGEERARGEGLHHGEPRLRRGRAVRRRLRHFLRRAQVAAAALLLKAQDPERTPEDIEGTLKDSARAVSDNDGIDDALEYGAGVLDAAAAVGWTLSSGDDETSPNTADGDPVSVELAAQLAMQSGVGKYQIPGALSRACAIDASCQGWLYVPGTLVSLPVAKEPEGQADFYLDHAFGGAESSLGAAYVDASSSDGFSDPVDAGTDRIVQISTCTMPATEEYRFVVTGLLVGERRL